MLTLPRPAREQRRFLSPVRRTGESAPRWEWRVFGTDLPLPSLPGLEMLDPEPPETDVYLLSPRCPFSIKARRGMVEVKRIEATDARDLELWRPIHRFALPLGADAVATVCVLLGVTPPAPPRGCALDELPGIARGITVVTVVKRRWRFRGEGYFGEHTAITVNGEPWTSVAVEGEDPDSVHAAARGLGLIRRANLSYPHALRLLFGLAEPPAD